jgi:hypothetical protein
MIRFSYSNKDTKDKEKERELVDKHDRYTGCGAERQVPNHRLVPGSAATLQRIGGTCTPVHHVRLQVGIS